MLNHALTLLMNVPGTAAYRHYLAGEVIDPGFLPVKLPGYLNKIRRVLFGADPDQHMLGYRCRQLLAVTHATPLNEFLLALDPRTTYDFADTALVSPVTWTPAVTTVAGRKSMTVQGDVVPPDSTGRVFHGVSVVVASPGVVTMFRTTTPFTGSEVGFEPGDRVPLPGTGLVARFASAAAGQQYAVGAFSRPRKDLAQLVAEVAALGDPVRESLFGAAQVEPYKTFRGLWDRKQEMPFQVAALVCAIAYRSEEARVA